MSAPAGRVLDGAVDEADVALEAEDEPEMIRIGEQRAEAAFPFLRRSLGRLERGHVLQHALDDERRAVSRSDHPKGIAQPALPAVAMRHPVLGHRREAGGERLAHAPAQMLEIGGLQHAAQQVRRAQPGGGRMPRHLLDLRADVLHLSRDRIERVDCRRQRLDQVAILRLAAFEQPFAGADLLRLERHPREVGDAGREGFFLGRPDARAAHVLVADHPDDAAERSHRRVEQRRHAERYEVAGGELARAGIGDGLGDGERPVLRQRREVGRTRLAVDERARGELGARAIVELAAAQALSALVVGPEGGADDAEPP
jgi:hypothetical protein